MVSLSASGIVALATIALAIITYFQIDEAKQMRIQTKRLVDIGVEQFKIKAYPDLSIVLRPPSYQSNSIIQVLEIVNRGEIAAFNVAHLLVNEYEKGSDRLFNNLFFYRENEEIRNALHFKFNISRDAKKIVVKQDPIPEKWSFGSLKRALLFVRFEVPYDTRYRYKSIGYRLTKDISAKEGEIIYRWHEMDPNDADFWIRMYMNSPSSITDSSRSEIKSFFRDFDLEYQ